MIVEPKLSKRNSERHEAWVKEQLLLLPSGSRVLDAGAGEQKFRKFAGHLNYFAQDFGLYDGKGNNEGLQTESWNYGKLDICSDITSIPVPDASFDAVLCSEVFEHIPDPVAALKELSRILKPGGVLLLTAPFCSFTHFAPYHFYSGFNRYWYEYHFPKAGFESLEVTPNGDFFEYLGSQIECFMPSYLNVPTRFSNSLRWLLQKILLRQKSNVAATQLVCFGFFVKGIRNKT